MILDWTTSTLNIRGMRCFGCVWSKYLICLGHVIEMNVGKREGIQTKCDTLLEKCSTEPFALSLQQGHVPLGGICNVSLMRKNALSICWGLIWLQKGIGVGSGFVTCHPNVVGICYDCCCCLMVLSCLATNNIFSLPRFCFWSESLYSGDLGRITPLVESSLSCWRQSATTPSHLSECPVQNMGLWPPFKCKEQWCQGMLRLHMKQWFLVC